MKLKGIKRRFDARSSSSEEYEFATGDCTIEFYYAFKDKFRAAPGLSVPVLWPSERSYSSADINSRQIANNLETEFKSVLSSHGIILDIFEVVTLGRSGLPDTNEDTLVIRTSDENPTIAWNNAATEIQGIIDNATNPVGTKLRVEIRNEKLMYRPHYYTIPSDSQISHTLEQVNQQINETVQALIGDSWRTIGFSKCGSFNDPDDRVPTLLVGVRPGSRHRWVWVMDQMEKYLQSLPQDFQNLDIEFVPSIVS